MAGRGDEDDDDGDATSQGAQRIDKWLWFVRVVKTRTLAAGLVHGGKVRINRAKIDKPSHSLKPGDVVTVAAGAKIRVLRVVAPGVRRGPPAEAQTLYEELTPPAPPRVGPHAEHGGDPGGRPNKKERRDLARLRRRD